MAEEPRPAFDYDELVDWEKRLSREAPFFRELFDSRGIKSLIDIGCGSGMHDILFASWGVTVLGVDPDEGMLAQARRNAAAAGADVRFERAGFGELRDVVHEPADALICLGNALPHVNGVEGLRRTLDDFAHVVKPGGTLVLHLLNHARLLAKKPAFLPPAVRNTPEGRKVFLKLLEYDVDDTGIFFEFLRMVRPLTTDLEPADESGGWSVRSKRSLHTALPATLLAEELAAAGFTGATLFGDHSRKDFSPTEDESIIVVAKRAG